MDKWEIFVIFASHFKLIFFKFMADNSDVEWAIAKLGIGSYGDMMSTTKVYWSDIDWEIHSHPKNLASEGLQIAFGASKQDMNHAYAFSKKELSPSLYVYYTKQKLFCSTSSTKKHIFDLCSSKIYKIHIRYTLKLNISFTITL